MQDEKVCYVSGATNNLVCHHIYGGRGRRKVSEKYGCVVWLTPEWHTGDHGVHFNKKLDLHLKQECQRKWEAIYGSREAFIKTFGRSYL